LSKQENKLRVYEYAKSLNMSSKEIITILKRMNMPVNNHMSIMENEMVEKVEQFFRDIKAGAAKRLKEGQATQPQQQKPAAQAQAADESRAQSGRDAAHGRGGNGGEGAAKAAGGKGKDPRAQQAKQHHQQGQSGQKQRGGESRGERRNGQQGAQKAGQRNGGQGGARPQQQRPPQQESAKAQPAYDRRNVASLPKADDDDEYVVTKGKTTKKNKANPKRFDDNKVSTIRGGAPRKGGNKNKQQRVEKVDNTPKKVIVRGTMTVGELAKLLHKDASEIIKKLLFLGTMATINQELDLDTIQLVANEFKIEVELKLPVEDDPFEIEEEPEDESTLVERPPVVTIMGHVDHGKTTLLDAIRHTRVSEGEAGGITQHIGAYQVEIKGKRITFLDTPGHEAFTTMRARGAKVTDITVLVVAADDGVMPQTVEAINHAKAANVPIIVAINKIDKPEANPDRIKNDLMEYGLVPEEWGGQTIFVNVSAKTKQNLDELLEMILLVAEVEELKANPDKLARGTVLEAELDKGRGPVARVLVQSGTLRVGDPFVAGVCFGRVRAMVNDKGRRIKEAGPSTPVEITGVSDVPQAGDRFIVFEDERKAREIAEKRKNMLRLSERTAAPRVTLDDLFSQIQQGEMKELNVIIKADVQGSVEALRGALEKIDIQGVRVRIIHSAVGAITESDIILASASNAIIIGFNVRPEPAAKVTAENEKVDIRLHSIIYKAIEEIEAAMKGMLDPEYREKTIGQAEVREIFRISKVGTIAGCMVTSGKIARNAQIRLIRDGIVVHEGSILALKRFKDDVREVAQGFECGISLEKFNDIKEGDIIEAFVMETVER
jgi:translation initiation factor IF-2